MELLIFSLLALWLIVSSLGTVFVKNPVHSILFFLSSVLAISALFLSLRAELLALLQLVIYAVAIIVFYVLVITTIPWEKVKRFEGFYTKELTLAFPPLALTFAVMSYMVLKGNLAEVNYGRFGTKEVGKTLFTQYLVPFEVISLLLLVAMVGAIILGRREEG